MRLNIRRIPRSGIILAAAALVLLLFSRQILWQMGAALVRAEPPEKSDVIAVLGGDYTGNRILKGCDLIRRGLAPMAFVSGSGGFFGNHESTLAIVFAVKRGCPEDYFVPVRFAASGTVEETRGLLPEIRRLGVRKLIVVTSPSHTARARRIFRRLAPDLEIHTVAARDPKWNDGYWWKTREGRKTWLLEATKTLADFIGL